MFCRVVGGGAAEGGGQSFLGQEVYMFFFNLITFMPACLYSGHLSFLLFFVLVFEVEPHYYRVLYQDLYHEQDYYYGRRHQELKSTG